MAMVFVPVTVDLSSRVRVDCWDAVPLWLFIVTAVGKEDVIRDRTESVGAISREAIFESGVVKDVEYRVDDTAGCASRFLALKGGLEARTSR